MVKSRFADAVQEAEAIIKKKFAMLEEVADIQVQRTISGVQVTDTDEESNGIKKAKENARETTAAMQQLRDRLKENQVPCIATLPKEAFIKLSDMLGLYRVHTKSGYVAYSLGREKAFTSPIQKGFYAIAFLSLAFVMFFIFFGPTESFPTFFTIATPSTLLIFGIAEILPDTIWTAFLKYAPAVTLLRRLWPDKYAQEATANRFTSTIKVAFRSVNKEFQTSLLKTNKMKTLSYGIAAQPAAIFFPDRKDAVKKWQEALRADPILYVYNERAVAIVSQSGEFKDEKALVDFTKQIDYLAHLNIISPNQEKGTSQQN